jgi:hypothetical protein
MGCPCLGLVLGNVDRPSSLVMSVSMAAKEVQGWINTAVANGVRWGIQSALVAAMSHFLKLKS